MKIKHLSKEYKTKYETVRALEEVHLNLPTKGLVFIVGVSGSGKTTLMNMLSGVDVPTTGEVIIGEKSLFKGARKELFGYRNSYVGLVFQDYNLIEDLNVYDNIKFPLELLGTSNYDIVDEVIKQVDIEDIKYSAVNEISSGQMQRVAIARALVKNSTMILADEPTGNLDSKNEKIVFDLLKEISKDRLVVVITHDDEAANIYGDRIIEIEDGNILQDTAPLEDVQEDTPTFIEPKIHLAQQIKLTKGFMRNNFVRSLSLLIVMILIPLLGSIITAYVFYDVSVAYKEFQEEYQSEFIRLSQPHGDFQLYYDPNDIAVMNFEYRDSNFIQLYDTHININPSDTESNYFYQPVIRSVIIYDDTFEVDGRLPATNTEILVTDYVLASIRYYQNRTAVNSLMIDGISYRIVGIVKTSFEDFLTKDFTNDYNRMVFQENLHTYNAIFTTENGYEFMRNNANSYYETTSFTVYSGRPIPVTKYEEIKVSKERSVPLIAGREITNTGQALVSRAFLEEGLEVSLNDFFISQRAILYSYSKARYRISIRISGVFESDEYEIILHNTDFNNNQGKILGHRILLSPDDPNYSNLVKAQYVTNDSFVYARDMWHRAEDAKIVMIEFLIVFIVILIAFTSIINSLTLTTEKKKIGIKYSFGIKKIPIVIPYILELLVYIAIGFITSTLIVRTLFFPFMKTFVYTTKLDLMAFDFFYVSWGSIIGWNLVVYGIMLTSLFVMIFAIFRKSPIEIIKDL